ncbi:MAG: hypothetical protein COA46_11870 [Porticoccaceae bacterium]|nr:MAG: hypothetical protein COA46_11870 [Porticoccaceae bacterium]
MLTPKNQLGLIDIFDMKIYKSIHHFIDGYRPKPGSPLCKESLANIIRNTMDIVIFRGPHEHHDLATDAVLLSRPKLHTKSH